MGALHSHEELISQKGEGKKRVKETNVIDKRKGGGYDGNGATGRICNRPSTATSDEGRNITP